jgi:hypothetical protein
MTKSETREISNILRYIRAGMIDTAARATSALIRCAMTAKSARELRAFAAQHGLTSNPEFIC